MKWPVTAHTRFTYMYMHYIQWMMFAVTLLVVHYSWPACDWTCMYTYMHLHVSMHAHLYRKTQQWIYTGHCDWITCYYNIACDSTITHNVEGEFEQWWHRYIVMDTTYKLPLSNSDSESWRGSGKTSFSTGSFSTPLGSTGSFSRDSTSTSDLSEAGSVGDCTGCGTSGSDRPGWGVGNFGSSNTASLSSFYLLDKIWF